MMANDNETEAERAIIALTQAAFDLASPYIRAHLAQTDPEFGRRLRNSEEHGKPEQ